MGGYHMRAEFPEDATRQEKKEIVATAYEHAFEHARTDPEMRLRMIMGEAYRKYAEAIRYIQTELAKEPEAVRLLANKFAGRPDLIAKPIRDATVAHTHQVLLIDACSTGDGVKIAEVEPD